MLPLSVIISFVNIENKVSFKNKKYAISDIKGCIGQKKTFYTKQIIICDLMLPLFSKYKKSFLQKKF